MPSAVQWPFNVHSQLTVIWLPHSFNSEKHISISKSIHFSLKKCSFHIGSFLIITVSIINISVSILVGVWAAAQSIPLPSSEASPPQPRQSSLPHSESSPEPGLQTLAGSAGYDAPGSGTQTSGQSLSHPPSQSSQVGKHTAWTHTPTAMFSAAQVAKLLFSSSSSLFSSSYKTCVTNITE